MLGRSLRPSAQSSPAPADSPWRAASTSTASRQAVGELVPTTPAPPIPAGAAFPELGTPTVPHPGSGLLPNRHQPGSAAAARRGRHAAHHRHGRRADGVHLRRDPVHAAGGADDHDDLRVQRSRRTVRLDGNFIGVPLLDLLDEAGIQSGAQQVVGHSVDGFTLGTPLDLLRATGKQAMLAIGMNREALLPEHGFPMRTVVPGLYGYVSATKWLTELELDHLRRQALLGRARLGRPAPGRRADQDLVAHRRTDGVPAGARRPGHRGGHRVGAGPGHQPGRGAVRRRRLAARRTGAPRSTATPGACSG